MVNGSFLRHAAIYGAGSILLQAGGIVLTPFYTRCLDPSEFGGLEMIRRFAEIAVIVLLFNAWRQTALAFHGRCEDAAKRGTVATTIVLLILGIALMGILALTTSGDWLAAQLDVGRADIFCLAVVAAFMEALFGVFLVFPQARQESVFFVCLTLGQFLLRVAVILVFVLGFHWGIRGIFLASALVAGLFAFGLAIRECRRGGWPDWSQLPAMLRFALPFLPTGLCYFLLNNGDRFFLKPYGGERTVGIYALGYQIALGVGVLARTPLVQVWSARMYEMAKRPDAPVVFGTFFTRLLGGYVAVGLAVSLFQDEAVAVMGTARYAEAALVIAPIILAYFFQAAADLMDAGFYVTRRTIHKTWITPVSTAIMVALYALLIPRWMALGAALATLFGFMAHAGLTFLVSQRVFPVQYEWRRLTAMLGLAILVWLVAGLLPVGMEAVPIKLGLWASWIGLLWIGGAISSEEKATVAALWRQLRLRRRVKFSGAIVGEAR